MTSEASASTRRAYHSPRRALQAAQTRAAVVDAASVLFAERGWAETGMRDIAKQAGVSVETVYATFGSKSELLMAAIDVNVVGDAEPVALEERPEFAALATGDRTDRVRAAARLVAQVHGRTSGLILTLREAAASDEGAAARFNAAEQARRRDIRSGAAMLAGRAVDERDCDALWAVTDAEVFRLLTDVRGWSVRQYEDWLVEFIGWQLRIPQE